jgi:hypothetical protein
LVGQSDLDSRTELLQLMHLAPHQAVENRPLGLLLVLRFCHIQIGEESGLVIDISQGGFNFSQKCDEDKKSISVEYTVRRYLM